MFHKNPRKYKQRGHCKYTPVTHLTAFQNDFCPQHAPISMKNKANPSAHFGIPASGSLACRKNSNKISTAPTSELGSFSFRTNRQECLKQSQTVSSLCEKLFRQSQFPVNCSLSQPVLPPTRRSATGSRARRISIIVIFVFYIQHNKISLTLIDNR